MKRFLIGSVIAATMIAVSLPAQEIKKRQENQQDRIAQGVASGELTAAETARLEKKEARLNRKIRKDRKDGNGLTAKERRQINRRQNQISNDIARQKHDAQKQ
jgi:hypothetical protein